MALRTAHRLHSGPPPSRLAPTAGSRSRAPQRPALRGAAPPPGGDVRGCLCKHGAGRGNGETPPRGSLSFSTKCSAVIQDRLYLMKKLESSSLSLSKNTFDCVKLLLAVSLLCMKALHTILKDKKTRQNPPKPLKPHIRSTGQVIVLKQKKLMVYTFHLTTFPSLNHAIIEVGKPNKIIQSNHQPM